MKPVVAACLAMAGLSACQPVASPVGEAVDQAHLCEVSDFDASVVAKACKPGQKIVFLPSRWGNEQLPVVFAALNCDLRHSVVATSGGVTCIYQGIGTKADPAADAASAPGKN